MADRSRLGRQSAATAGWAMASVAVSFLAGLTTARMLGPGNRGTLAVTLTMVGLLTLAGSLGTNIAFRVLLPRDATVTIGTFRRLSTKLAVPNIVVLVLLTLLFSQHVDRQLARPGLVVCIALVGAVTFFSNQMLDCFNALHQSSRSARLNAVGALTTALMLVVCWVAGFGLIAALSSYALGFAVRIGLGSVWLWREPATREPERGPGGQATLLRTGLPLMGGNLGQAVMLRFDQFLVGVLLGTHAAGLYAVAATPAGVLVALSNAVGQATLAEAAHGRLSRNALIRQTVRATGATLVLAVVGAALTPWLLPIVFGVEFTGSTRVAQALLLAQVALTPFVIVNRACTGYGLVRWSGITGGFGAASLVVSVLLLGPRHGLIGVAVAVAVTFVLATAFTTVVLAVRRPWHDNPAPDEAAERLAESAPGLDPPGTGLV